MREAFIPEKEFKTEGIESWNSERDLSFENTDLNASDNKDAHLRLLRYISDRDLDEKGESYNNKWALVEEVAPRVCVLIVVFTAAALFVAEYSALTVLVTALGSLLLIGIGLLLLRNRINARHSMIDDEIDRRKNS